MRYRYGGAGLGFLLGCLWWWLGAVSQVSFQAVYVPIFLAVLQGAGGFYFGKILEDYKKQAHHDSLTEVLVNRQFFKMMDREIQKAKIYEYSVTLLVIDLDHFKKYNDEHGHLEGDKILKRFARFLRENVRGNDLVGRWGGEEFVVLLPHTCLEAGVDVGLRLQNKIRQQIGEVTVSIGVASYPDHATTATELTAYADQMMYQAKKQRDCLYCGPVGGEIKFWHRDTNHVPLHEHIHECM
ncbi:GGDEF domain-containing protein [Brevibacillus laterosporus]|uniref:GGDEF domain-containing protein n=1 Tax=Brevibacillus laterosporus TaxID=1465 RepID=UPI002E20499C|nr:GGDEF domain-containing protein [Brevibacillus laterosporus]